MRTRGARGQRGNSHLSTVKGLPKRICADKDREPRGSFKQATFGIHGESLSLLELGSPKQGTKLNRWLPHRQELHQLRPFGTLVRLARAQTPTKSRNGCPAFGYFPTTSSSSDDLTMPAVPWGRRGKQGRRNLEGHSTANPTPACPISVQRGDDLAVSTSTTVHDDRFERRGWCCSLSVCRCRPDPCQIVIGADKIQGKNQGGVCGPPAMGWVCRRFQGSGP